MSSTKEWKKIDNPNIDKEIEQIDLSIAKLEHEKINVENKIEQSIGKVKYYMDLVQKNKALLEAHKNSLADKEKSIETLKAIRFYKALKKENIVAENLNLNKTASLLKQYESDIKDEAGNVNVESASVPENNNMY